MFIITHDLIWETCVWQGYLQMTKAVGANSVTLSKGSDVTALSSLPWPNLVSRAHRSNRSVVSSSQNHTPTLGNDGVQATRLRVTGDSRGRPSVDIGLVRFVPLRTTAHALVGWQLVYCRFTRQDQWFRLVGKESFKLRSTVDP
jgi:hypothetical protein